METIPSSLQNLKAVSEAAFGARKKPMLGPRKSSGVRPLLTQQLDLPFEEQAQKVWTVHLGKKNDRPVLIEARGVANAAISPLANREVYEWLENLEPSL